MEVTAQAPSIPEGWIELDFVLGWPLKTNQALDLAQYIADSMEPVAMEDGTTVPAREAFIGTHTVTHDSWPQPTAFEATTVSWVLGSAMIHFTGDLDTPTRE